MSLAGKVAIVTGASRGIGKATALALAGVGASVVVAARTEQERQRVPGTIHETVSEIVALGGRALAVPVDVSDEASVNAMVRRTLDEFGQVDIMINNAAGAFYKPVLDTPVERWELVVGVNLRGTFLCSKAVLPSMIEQRRGSIINMSSKSADLDRVAPTGAAYGATKAAIERFTTILAEEVRQYGIAVNSVKPRGAVVTEGMQLQRPGADLSGWDQPGDFIVKAILLLAQQDASGITAGVFVDDELCREYSLV